MSDTCPVCQSRTRYCVCSKPALWTEIERLRAENVSLRNALRKDFDAEQELAEAEEVPLTEQQIENALRFVGDAQKNKVIRQLQAEIERLQAALKSATEAVEALPAGVLGYDSHGGHPYRDELLATLHKAMGETHNE